MNLNAHIYTCCNEINVTDITGNYDAATNPTGWEIADINDVDKVIVKVEIDGVVKLYDVTSQFTTLTPKPENVEYDPIAVEVPDGIINVELIYYHDYEENGIEQNGIIDSYGVEILNTSNAECCLSALLAKTICDPCESKVNNELVIMESLLYALKATYACGKKDKALEILERIHRYCDTENCDC